MDDAEKVVRQMCALWAAPDGEWVLSERVDTHVMGDKRIPLPVMNISRGVDGKLVLWRDYYDTQMVKALGLTYHYWPSSLNSHTFEGTLYFVPAEPVRERVAHEMAAATFKEFGLQDANTLEATQSMVAPASSYRELEALYDAVTPRADAAITYCDQYPLDSLPPDTLNLLYLLYSWVTVSFAIECWYQPAVPDSGAAYLDCLAAPVP